MMLRTHIPIAVRRIRTAAAVVVTAVAICERHCLDNGWGCVAWSPLRSSPRTQRRDVLSSFLLIPTAVLRSSPSLATPPTSTNSSSIIRMPMDLDDITPSSSSPFSPSSDSVWISASNSSNKTQAVVPSTLRKEPEEQEFRSAAFGKQEYTNSITASRDTNISPAEAYDVIQQRIPVASSLRSSSSSTSAKKKDDDLVVVVDVGAGAGVSTALLWRKGYRNIRAVDWSDTAWQESVSQQQQAIPETVQFFAMDDEAFFQKQGQKEQKYDVIVYNFAINFEKAVSVARQHLVSSDNNNNQSSSLLLAPVNEKVDYWYKQRYVVLNSRGEVVWQSDDSIGAWSIQFQPDVTASSCTASIWCGPWNGYQPSPPQQQRRSNE